MRDGKLANALGSAATAKISALKKFKNIIIKNYFQIKSGFLKVSGELHLIWRGIWSHFMLFYLLFFEVLK